MTKISPLARIDYAKLAKSTAVTVYFMTAVKAAVRPAFIMGDKKNDEQTKKYTTVKEVLYQALCLGMAALMIPLMERGGFKLAEKQLAKIADFKNKNITELSKIDIFKNLADLKGGKKLKEFKNVYKEKIFDDNFVSQAEEAKKAKKANKLTKDNEKILLIDEALHFVNGGVETGSFLASILGLTLLAPMISHEILHPIMHVLGMSKQEDKDTHLAKPDGVFLADAKIPTEEKTNRVNINA